MQMVMKKTYTIKNFAKRLVMVLAVGLMAVNTWGTVLFREDFGNNSSSARAWRNDYITQSGVSAVYSGATSYTVTNAKQSKNTMGHGTQTSQGNTDGGSAIVSNQGNQGTVIIGPLNVASYESLALTHWFGKSSAAADTWNESRASNPDVMKVSYSTNNSTWIALTRTGSNPNSGAVGNTTTNHNYVQASYTLPAAAQVSTLYLKFEFYCYKLNNSSQQIGAVYIDEVELTGTAAGYAITYNNGGHGTAPSNTTASAVTLSAITGVTGYTCTGWKANVAVTNTSTSASISAGTLIPNGTGVTLSQATTFTAQWETTKYTVSFAVSPAGYGTVSQASVTNVPHGTVPSSSTNTVTVNGTTVTATPHAQDADYNYAFSSWSNVPASVTGAVTITANFTRTTRPLTNYRTTCCTKYDITLASSGSVTGGTFEADPASACEGTSISITATPGNGYAFSSWTIDKEGGGTVSPAASSATTSFTMPSDNVTVTAAFSCVAPTFTVHPASKTDYLTTDIPTPLGYTASAAGASLTQQWQVSDDNSNWSNIGGATSTTYTPVISSAGTKYYRVVVTNGTCGTSANSNVATITSVAPSVCLTPTFSVEEGTYTSNQSVTLSCATPGATIHYTTDGTTPDGSSPTYSSAIAVASTTTINAIAVKDGLVNSPVASATYTIKCATPTFSVAAGTYTSSQTVTISTTYGTSIYYTTNGSEPTTGSTLYNGAITVSTTQTVKAIAVKTGCTNSAVGSAAYTIQCATPTFSPAAGTYNADQSVTLSTTYGAKIYYTTNGTDPTTESTEYSGAISITQTTTIKAIAWTSGCTSSATASATYTMKCATPTFSVAAGTYTGNQSVEISCTTPGVTIHYTTDGSTPDGSSPTYSSAIAVNSTQTIKTIAMKSNWTTSDMATAAYTIKHNVTWNVNGETYSTGVVDGNSLVTHGSKISAMATAPADNTLSSCASKFMGWSCKNFGSTPKTTASGQYDDLFTTTGGSPYITQDTTFYAVFAEVGGANVNDTLWYEDWKGYSNSNTPSSPNTGDGYGAVVYGSASITYTFGTSGKVTTDNGGALAGGASPEAFVAKNGDIFGATGILPGGADSLTLQYKQNGNGLKVGISGTGYSFQIGNNTYNETPSSSVSGTKTYTILCGSAATFSLTFTSTSSNNVRLDNILVIVKTPSYSNYRTQCDPNMVKVTYNGNSGTTSCANGEHDKRNDYTVCSSAPTRDYYSFTGWLCSADDRVYQANETIDADDIDDDFTLTAQWSPVPYSITYNLNGGTNAADPITSYNVETVSALPTPTYDHKRFDGWYTDNNVWSNQVASITAGMHGNLTLYAKWTARNTIIFEVDGAQTTIYRANDENLEDAVAGQGTKPVNPAPPTACSKKVFVGWSASEIDDETDTRPGDLTNATGTVNTDKHYYAVWAIQSGTPIAAVEDNSFTGGEYTTYFSKTYGLKSNDKYVYKNSIWTSSDMTAGTKVKIKVKHLSNSSVATLTIALINSSGTVVTSTTLSTTANSNNIDNAAYSSNVELIPTTAVTGYQITLSNIGSSSGVVILAATREVVATHSAYSTSCCATKVTLSENSPEHGTIEFGKTKVGTCGDKEVSLTITPAAGYQLHSYEVATGSGKVATKSVSPAISLDNNSSAAQNITLTFAEDANGAYDVTASFTDMVASAWTWTKHVGGATITTDPVEVYVGQKVQVDVSYEPAGLLSNHTNASAYNYSPSPWSNPNLGSPAKAGDHFTVTGTNAGSTSVVLNHNDGLTKTIYYTVLALEKVHFEDLVHGKAFADVEATVSGDKWTVSWAGNTPTSDNWTTPNANTCETNHLHLVGWIRSDWPALVAYLNGTGDKPTTTAIVGAGNDGEGHAYFLAPGASINVQTFDGKTFYAVWAEVK